MEAPRKLSSFKSQEALRKFRAEHPQSVIMWLQKKPSDNTKTAYKKTVHRCPQPMAVNKIQQQVLYKGPITVYREGISLSYSMEGQEYDMIVNKANKHGEPFYTYDNVSIFENMEQAKRYCQGGAYELVIVESRDYAETTDFMYK